MDKRTIWALTLSFFLLMAYQFFMAYYFPPAQEEGVTMEPADKADSGKAPVQETKGDGTAAGGMRPVGGMTPVERSHVVRGDDAAAAPLMHFNNRVMDGQIGGNGQIIETTFLKHQDKVGADARPIHYLSAVPAKPFVAETGYFAVSGMALPGRNTRWQPAGPSELHDDGEMRLTWDNGAGLLFEKIFRIQKESYLMTITDRVTNRSGVPVSLQHYAQLMRVVSDAEAEAAAKSSGGDFQGPTAFVDDARIQHAYEDLRNKDNLHDAKSGWIGFNDRYFLAAFSPLDGTVGKKYYFDYDAPAYRLGVVLGKMELAPGEQNSSQVHLYVGPKELKALEEQKLKLERAIDFGWLQFLAEPLVQLLVFFNRYVNNYGVAIILLTILIKILFFPLANKSYRSMNEMKKLQPKVDKLRQMYADDKQTLNQEMMRLYQENKVNPLGGCLPMLVQLPVFFALYRVLYLAIELRHAPLFLWIHDLSDQDPYYVLPVLMGVSMLIQTKLNPAPADPVQAKVMMFLPVIFTAMFLTFPSGLVLYWLVQNVLSIFQQAYIIKLSNAEG